MKKFLAIMLSLLMVVSLFTACGNEKAPETTTPPAVNDQPEGPPPSYMEQLIAAAKAEGTLVVYGSCEEEYLAVACE